MDGVIWFATNLLKEESNTITQVNEPAETHKELLLQTIIAKFEDMGKDEAPLSKDGKQKKARKGGVKRYSAPHIKILLNER